MNKFNHKQTEELAKLVSPDRFSTGRSNLELHRRDISPHRGELPAAVVWPKSTVDQFDVVGYVFGHAGNGNLHVVLVGDPSDLEGWRQIEEINDRIVTRAVELGGTCTGEHGVGIGKRKFMQREHGESFERMRRIKMLLDPKGLMNPGKIFA